MVEPNTMAIMASQVLGGGLDIIDKQRQKAFQEAITEGQVENFTDLITEQKLDAARKTADIQGKGVNKAAKGGVQVSGSAQMTIGQDIFDTQLEALRQIRQLKYQRTMAELGNESTLNQLTGAQVGSAIKTAGSVATTYQGDKAESDLAKIKKKDKE